MPDPKVAAQQALQAYDEWETERADLAERDCDPDRTPSSTEWQNSDDAAVEIMRALAGVVRSSYAEAPARSPETQLADASMARAKAATEETEASILLLAQAAREDFPEAKGIKLDDSDQGNYYIIAALLDEDESEIEGGYEFDDNTGYVNALDDTVFSIIEPFCKKGPDGQPRAYVDKRMGITDAVLDIDKILGLHANRLGLSASEKPA